MMDPAGIEVLAARVLSCAFGLAVLFGAIVQRTRFCTMGAISDAVTMGDWNRLRMWALALAVAVGGFALLATSGTVDPQRTLYAAARLRWLSAFVGGVLFGFGMVLASGCGSKLLVRAGAGNLKSLVALLVMGITAFATLKGMTGVLRTHWLDPVGPAMPPPADLPGGLAVMTGLARSLVAPWLAAAFSIALGAWALRSGDFRRADNLLGGVGIGLIIVAMWWVTGSLAHVVEHPETLEPAMLATQSGRAEAFSFVAPVAHTLDWLLFFSDRAKVLSVGVVSVFGVVLGSFVVALLTGRFRWEGFGGTEDLANHLVGGTLMGVGGVTAMGCTIGQGLSGLSTLSLMSFVAIAAIAVGALWALRWQAWRVERSA